MRRHLRRPVGNSRRLWERVDGEDPWDLPKRKVPPKQRGVYAAGRFVRIDQATPEGRKKAAEDHVPDWARAAQKAREAARSTPQPTEAPAPTPAPAPQRRAPQASQPSPKPADGPAPTPVPRPAKSARRRASVSKSGRVRTSQGGAFGLPEQDPEPAPKRPIPPEERRYAAGRTPPKPRAAPKDLPIEMRRPPRVDPHAKKDEAPIDPRQRRYAAGRAPPPPRQKAKDVPIEARRVPRIDPETGEDLNRPDPAKRRYAAGRAPPPPRQKPKDIPLEHRFPSRMGPDGKPLPAASEAVPESPPEPAAAPEPPASPASRPSAPVDRTPPKPKPPSAPPDRSLPKPGGGGGLDDLFGVAASEGRVRIGRRKKKAAEDPDAADGEGDKG